MQKEKTMPDRQIVVLKPILSLIVWGGVFLSVQHNDTLAHRLVDTAQINPRLALQDADYDLSKLLTSMQKRVMIGVFGTDAAQLERDLEDLRYQLALTQTDVYRPRFQGIPGATNTIDITSSHVEELQDRIRALRPGDIDDFGAIQDQLRPHQESLSQLVENSRDWSQNQLADLKRERDLWTMIQYGLVAFGALLSVLSLLPRRAAKSAMTAPAPIVIVETPPVVTPERRKLFSRARRGAEPFIAPVVASVPPAVAEVTAESEPVRINRLSPVELLDDVARDISAWTNHRGLSLACTIDPEVPTELKAPENRLRQVLRHLVGNAIKFTHEGGIVITADMTEATREQAAELCISVLDTGIGIEPCYRDMVFGAQVQVDPDQAVDFSAFDPDQRGEGDGLAYVRAMVNDWGGHSGVETKPGQGSRFWFTLPVIEPGLPVARADQALWQSVLLVDSDPVRREAIADQCRALGANVVVVEHAFAAIEAIILHSRNRAATFDLALIMAPHGLSSMVPLLRQFEQLSHVPHHIALAMPEGNVTNWDAGANYHLLPLPVPSQALLGLLEQISRQSTALEPMTA